MATCTREFFTDWGSISPFSSGDNFFIFVCTKGNLLFLINTFGTNCIKQPEIVEPLISPTEILIDDIKRIRSQMSRVDHSSFYRLVEKLDIDWEKVLFCCLESRNEDMLCYLIDTSFYHQILKETISRCINPLVIKAFCWRSGQVLKLLLENFGHLNELRQVDNIVLNENLLAGAQYVISMFNRDGRHKYRNKPFSVSESRAEFETFYKQVTELKESRNHHHASLEIFFNVEINKKGF